MTARFRIDTSGFLIETKFHCEETYVCSRTFRRTSFGDGFPSGGGGEEEEGRRRGPRETRGAAQSLATELD